MADSARFSQEHGIMPLTIDGDWTAGFTSDSLDMSKYNHCTIVMIGDTSVAGNGIITVYGGLTDAATTAAITFTYRYAGGNVAAASSDVYDTPLTSAALTTLATSLDLRTFLIEIDAEDLNVSGVQYRYVTVVVDATGSAGTVSLVAILSEPKYERNIMFTANPA